MYYALPNVVCVNCNEPLAHLYPLYQQLTKMNYTQEEIFNMINLKNYCCRKELAQSQIIVTIKPDEQKILGQMKSTSVLKNASITPLPSTMPRVYLQEKFGIPTCYSVGHTTALNDHMIVHHVGEATYLAL